MGEFRFKSKITCNDIKRYCACSHAKQISKETPITFLQRRPPDSQTELRATEVTETRPRLQAPRTEAQRGDCVTSAISSNYVMQRIELCIREVHQGHAGNETEHLGNNMVVGSCP